MRDEAIAPILNDPTLHDPAAARALIALADKVAWHDPDIAGDVLLIMTERLAEGGAIRVRLGTHANPAALIVVSAKNAASQAREAAARFKREMPLTADGDLLRVEPVDGQHASSMSLFDALSERGWTTAHLQNLAMPVKRSGRSVHPGIQDAMQKLAACFGITERCQGCPTAMDYLRVDLRGPGSWPVLVDVLREWQWTTEVIDLVTTSPVNVAHWRDLHVTPPYRQERRLVEIVRKMRWEPWLLQDADIIRASVRPSRPQPSAAHVIALAPKACLTLA